MSEGVAPGYSCSAPPGLTRRAVAVDPGRYSVISHQPGGFETASSLATVFQRGSPHVRRVRQIPP